MGDESRYYWIKLKTDFFAQDAVDFLMGQENGCEYIVLYQMLCLQTANSDGALSTKIGEMIIPYDVKKIVRDTKYFDTDTVVVALEMFKRLGLIYQQEDGMLKIADFDNMVGCETKWAEKKRKYREKSKVDSLEDNAVDTERTLSTNSEDNVRQENRDKRLEIRDKNLEKETEVLTVSKDTVCRTDVQRALEAWNALSDCGIKSVSRLTAGTKRYDSLVSRIKQYGIEAVLEAIEKVRNSDFLQGKNGKGWQITFDWFVLPNNFPKVFDGNYDNGTSTARGGYMDRIDNRVSEVDNW